MDRDRLTCAGGTSVVHLAAHVIERHFSRSHAVKSLRILLEDAPLPSNTWQPESVVTQRAQDSVVRQAMLAIEQNLAEQRPLVEILRSLGIGMRQIERRFVADVGIGPREYRSRLRLARAKWMLEHTDTPVMQIGLECGFLDASHFARSFRRQFKATPSRARTLATV
ncbi:MAG: helix-turn-helix domain-containing protein [Gammaproteobacteria bacterium]